RWALQTSIRYDYGKRSIGSNRSAPRQLFDQWAHCKIVVVDAGSQTDRVAVSVFHLDLFRDWGHVCLVDPLGVDYTARRSADGGNLQPRLHDARRDDDLFLSDPIHPGDVGELSVAADAGRERRGVSAIEPV